MATNNENNNRQQLLAGAADDGENPVDIDALIRSGEAQLTQMAQVHATLDQHGETLNNHEGRLQETERDVDLLKTVVFDGKGFGQGFNLGQAQAQEGAPALQRSAFARVFFGFHRALWSVVTLPFRILRAILGFFFGILRAALVNLLTLAIIVVVVAYIVAYILAQE